MADIPKILVIGEGRYPKEVDSFDWNQVLIGDLPNISEYDVVIINLSKITPDKATILSETPELNVNYVHNLLWAGHELVLITDGRTRISLEDRSYDIFSFLPCQIPLEKDVGGTLKIIDERYKDYYEKYVSRWRYYVKNNCTFSLDDARLLLSDSENDSTSEYFCEISEVMVRNGYNMPISFSVVYGYIIKPELEPELFEIQGYEDPKIKSGPITFLQAPDNPDMTEEAINNLLSGYGVHIKTSSPKWTESFKVPGEEEANKEKEEFDEKKLKLEKKIEEKEKKIEDIIKFKRLLFEKGDELKYIVWNTLEEIGFKVNREDEGQEDGCIEENSKIILLEIKGRDRKGLATKDLRQLDDWITRYLSETDIEPKGLCIINQDRLEKPENRVNSFSPDTITYLEKSSRDLAVMTTIQLFEIFCKIKTRKLDKEKIKKKIMNTKGIFSF